MAKATAEKKEQAKQLQNNPLIREILANMRETTVMQWRVSQEPMQRETAWIFHRSVDQFEATLDGYISEILKAETQE